MKALVISGSIGKSSCTRTLLQRLEQLLQKAGAETTFWDMGERPLPIAVPEYYLRPDANPDKLVGEFVTAVRDAHGIILGSPLYHGSYSGVLKNALDNLSLDAFARKPVGLVSHSSNARSCAKPSTDLRPIVSSLGGYPTLVQIGTTDSDYDYDDENDCFRLIDKSGIKRCQELVDELLDLASLLHTGP
jgi:azobenzene reductase